MDKKTILVTGGAGFIGSNFIKYFLNKYNNYYLVNIDVLTESSNLNYIEEFKNDERYSFIKGNICDSILIKSIFEEYDIKGVLHFAAESHVDNSILAPELFVQTNIIGTFTLLNTAKNYWIESPFSSKKGYEQCRFHHISTDEVYGTLGKEGFFTEHTPYAPNSPYSASKASSDMLVRSYHHTYGLNVTISNCSNNYGKHQHDEKLIPTIIRNALLKNPIPIYGNGENIRDWLYVDDHCKAIDIIYHNAQSGENYVIGGNSEITNLAIANNVCEILNEILPVKDFSYKQLISFVKDRPGHDFRYAIDFSKLKKQFEWRPLETFESGLRKTVQWYVNLYSKKYK